MGLGETLYQGKRSEMANLDCGCLVSDLLPFLSGSGGKRGVSSFWTPRTGSDLRRRIGKENVFQGELAVPAMPCGLFGCCVAHLPTLH
jgi:hypothetical protein